MISAAHSCSSASAPTALPGVFLFSYVLVNLSLCFESSAHILLYFVPEVELQLPEFSVKGNVTPNTLSECKPSRQTDLTLTLLSSHCCSAFCSFWVRDLFSAFALWRCSYCRSVERRDIYRLGYLCLFIVLVSFSIFHISKCSKIQKKPTVYDLMLRSRPPVIHIFPAFYRWKCNGMWKPWLPTRELIRDPCSPSPKFWPHAPRQNCGPRGYGDYTDSLLKQGISLTLFICKCSP